jgi:heme exporter protein CcmD
MNTGVIQGGWEFVWAAYALSAAILGGYALSVFVRHSALRRRQAGDDAAVIR